MEDPSEPAKRRRRETEDDGGREGRARRKDNQRSVTVGDTVVPRNADMKFQCTHCRKAYSTPYSLQRHFADSHAEPSLEVPQQTSDNERSLSPPSPAPMFSSQLPRPSWGAAPPTRAAPPASQLHPPSTRLFLIPHAPSRQVSPRPLGSRAGSPPTMIPAPVTPAASRPSTRTFLGLRAISSQGSPRPLVSSPGSPPTMIPGPVSPAPLRNVSAQRMTPTPPGMHQPPPIRATPTTAMEVDVSLYDIVPDDHTVIYDDAHNLPALGIVINTFLKIVICIECGEAIEPASVCAHVKQHNAHYTPGPTLLEDLRRKYGIVSLAEIAYSAGPIRPIFGIPIEADQLHFCSKCHRGYNSLLSLRGHQSNGQRCQVPITQRACYTMYGQILTKGPSKRYFPVDTSCLSLRQDIPFAYSTVFGTTMPPPPDYTQLPVQDIEDPQNLSSFLFREGWLDAVKGLTPVDIQEVTRLPDAKTEPWGKQLQLAAHHALASVQLLVNEHHTFGMTHNIAQFNQSSNMSSNNFNHIQPETQQRYGNIIVRLIFNVLRTMDSAWTSPVRYPALDESQKVILLELRAKLDGGDKKLIDEAYQKACYSLFAHERRQYPISSKLRKFFSPVILFVVFYSLRANGSFRLASEITGICAAVEYCIRATMLFEIERISEESNVSSFDALKKVERYISTGQETPMAFIYNVHRVLASVRSDEVTASQFRFTDKNGREVSCNGHLISLSMIKKMHDEEHVRYENMVQDRLFFGEDIPSDLFPELDLESIVDSANNTSAGYCFLDDPRNNFSAYRDSYGRWLLSDPVRAQRFVYMHEGELVWKPSAALDLLRRMERVREVLAPGVSYSTLLQVRGSEFARALLRNTPAALRNLRFEMHLLAHVALQDKTSHLHLKDRHIPHVITREWAESLIRNLAVFRPFEEVLVAKFLNPEALHRYRVQLWPGIKSTMTSEAFSAQCGDMTMRYLLQPFKPLRWRSLITAFARFLPDSRSYESQKEFFVDTAMMHSSAMSNNRYGRHSDQASQSDFRTTIGCIQAALDMQKHVGIGQARPFTLTVPSEVPETFTGGAQGIVHDVSSLERIARSAMLEITGSLEDRVKETILDSMAVVMAQILPKTPRPLNENNLRPVADIDPHPSRLRSLRQFLKRPAANFSCPEQALLLELMCRGQQSVLGILGTGKGKTMLVFLYAYLFGSCGITVVILPLSSLRIEYSRRAQELDISSSIWTPTAKHNLDVQLLCVSIEHVNFHDFESDLASLEHQKRLNCIIFDEVHKVVTDITYRPSFEKFWVLNKVKAPIYGLSGSLPPSTMAEFNQLTGTTWKVVRTTSNRPELAYRIIHVTGDMLKRLVEDIAMYIANYGPRDRLMVFCRTKEDVTALSDALRVPGFTSHTTETNDDTLRKWRSGENIVIVATSILGCGLDYPSVRHVLHWGIAHSMVDQHQQESRAGRDGQRAEAITYVASPSRRYSKSATAHGLSELEKWSSSTDMCLRAIPSSYLDGVPITCSLLPNCELCAYCLEQMNVAPPLRVASISHLISDPVSVPAKPQTTPIRPPFRVFVPPKTPITPVIQSGESTPASAVDLTSSSAFCQVSSPSTLVAGASDDSGTFGTTAGSPVSPTFHSAKRVLPEDDNTASKRF
ncbi:ATP-dependent DNA helicase tlh1 [Psilocybe cubensis]|uniref:ATP-dependent DNA helicase tlh1 n=2 Tax=Psilocybe cubensis TaxID=181762 RepID=A0ACB8GNN3_PSICU|nr:ATP-dependent DNA helicase tlh1 [Psilocybe cubensis]KAH9477263.1 ATP-dependent DNA helicase tlh1 [Psilocybe cubensis]